MDLEYLFRCLDSLTSQDISQACANEVLLVDSGDTPPDLLERLGVAYPWVSIHRVSPETDYYEAKMAGAKHVTGDVIFFCDSDCRYESGWLRNLLLPFSENDNIQIVTGETSMDITGPYSFAIALIWGFPRFSRRKELYKVSYYTANNVAFRREFLMRYPIPSELPTYRKKSAIHADEFRPRGYTIWKQDQARTIHPLPAKGLSEFFLLFLLKGHDWLIWHRLSGSSSVGDHRIAALRRDLVAFLRIAFRCTVRPLRNLLAALREDPRRVVFLPLALPIVLAAILILLSGSILTCFNDGFLFTYGVKKLEAD